LFVRDGSIIPKTRWHGYTCRRSCRSAPSGGVGRHWRETDTLSTDLTNCLPMPKSRGRKPKKKRAPASAPKKRLDNLAATPQELPLSTHPPQEPQPLATAPRQEQPTLKIKQIAKLTTAVVLAAIAIVNFARLKSAPRPGRACGIFGRLTGLLPVGFYL
jgi:hypothetical protein